MHSNFARGYTVLRLGAIQSPCQLALLELNTPPNAFFGRKTLDREQFERSWKQLDAFHAELTQLEKAAA